MHSVPSDATSSRIDALVKNGLQKQYMCSRLQIYATTGDMIALHDLILAAHGILFAKHKTSTPG
jgi:hypothetical protein